MNQFRWCTVAVLAALLIGCSTFEPRELDALRARGVPPPIVGKLERDDPLTPPEIASLKRRGVPDEIIVRHLDSAGVDYLLTREDVRVLRRSGVSARVIDVLIDECDDFARDYHAPVYDTTDFWWGSSTYHGPGLYYPAWY
jgi:hypothetical protein